MKIQKNNKTEETIEENIMNTVVSENNTDENQVKEDNQINTIGDNLPDKMGNCKVIGQLVIDKIGVKNNILEKHTNEALNLSITKYYGADINHIGNNCLVGHNYSRMLKRLKELKVGDTFYMINKQEKTKVTYKIFDMYTCQPTDLKCLDPSYSGVKEVTLITCTPGGLKRLICKAKEI